MFRRCCHLVTYGLAYLFTCHTLSSCIDEDLSGCGKNYRIQYQVEIATEIDETLQNSLDEPEEMAVKEKLKQAFSTVKSEVANDVELNFYVDKLLAHSELHPMNSDEAKYTIYLKPNNYQHLAWANLKAETQVEAVGTHATNDVRLQQTPADTVMPHSYALFAARMPMNLNDPVDLYHVTLGMQNACFALVVNDRNLQPDDMQTHAMGFATAFAPADSTFCFDQPAVLKPHSLTAPNYHAFYATCFPSRNEPTALKANEHAACWKMEVLVKMNGKYTRSVLSVNEPLQAGEMRVVKAYLREDGSISTSDTQVGVSVELDWKPGGDHDIEI